MSTIAEYPHVEGDLRRPLLQVENLAVHFPARDSVLRAVDDASFAVGDSETVALVGESGSGKSLTALALTGLVPMPGRCVAGRVYFNGRDLLRLPPRALRAVRGGEIAYIFQDPATALNPVFRVGWQINEALRLHHPEIATGQEVERLLALVGLKDVARCRRAYPHELSGGMQQRVMIAMALACRPRLLVADEPTTALDVTVQAQILALLRRLQTELKMAILLITHNLALAAGLAHVINVMYAGRIVEFGNVDEILRAPAHPYTRGLLAAVPRLRGGVGEVRGIPGSVPHPARLPPGCKFHPRCAFVRPECRQVEPELEIAAKGHFVRCPYWKSMT